MLTPYEHDEQTAHFATMLLTSDSPSLLPTTHRGDHRRKSQRRTSGGPSAIRMMARCTERRFVVNAACLRPNLWAALGVTIVVVRLCYLGVVGVLCGESFLTRAARPRHP